ncbi:MAG: response regulator transcription factor [Chloroflexota bacterium]|nr:response regulator transcription factor [Chloroflexota bacterium]MDE3193133.1 response regulator transcription factor [Chloroflexota bacterium]
MDVAGGDRPFGDTSPSDENGRVRGPILVVDDDRQIRELVRRYLESDGSAVLTAATGAAALEMLRSASPALVVLDLGLPDVPGETVLREIRSAGDVPVLILSARAGEEDRLSGLGLGADDYVTKPFSPRELALRVRAILRRTSREAAAGARDELRFDGGELVIDTKRHEVRRGAEAVRLTPTEWGLLLALAEDPGRALTRAEIVNRVQGYEYEGYERTVDAHVKNLRRKVERDPQAPRLIETVPGVGYRFGGRPDA